MDDWARFFLIGKDFHCFPYSSMKILFLVIPLIFPTFCEMRTPNNILLIFHDMILLIMHQRSKDIIFSTYSWLHDSRSILLLDGWSTLYRIINLTGHVKSEMKSYKMVVVVGDYFSIVGVLDFLAHEDYGKASFTFGTKILLSHS